MHESVRFTANLTLGRKWMQMMKTTSSSVLISTDGELLKGIFTKNMKCNFKPKTHMIQWKQVIRKVIEYFKAQELNDHVYDHHQKEAT
mmetsp:Transcript_697/g.1465  ORF Transcript_697/g.1465 Transcript_697/m.1465 type:complete len:88 (+) Transcript_697:629-892(+)